MKCPICGIVAKAETTNPFNQDQKIYCNGCGIYKASEDVIEFSKGGSPEQINRAKEWIRSHPDKTIGKDQLRMFGIL